MWIFQWIFYVFAQRFWHFQDILLQKRNTINVLEGTNVARYLLMSSSAL